MKTEIRTIKIPPGEYEINGERQIVDHTFNVVIDNFPLEDGEDDPCDCPFCEIGEDAKENGIRFFSRVSVDPASDAGDAVAYLVAGAKQRGDRMFNFEKKEPTIKRPLETLRDDIAIAAMSAMLCPDTKIDYLPQGETSVLSQSISADAYKMAGAMLAAR